MRCAALLLLCLSSSVQAALGTTYTVTRTDDPPPDGCQPNDCSLREAVDAVSADASSFDNIDIGPGTYTVSAPALVVHGGLRIYGGGSAQTFVLGDGSDDLFRLDTAAQFSMEDLTLDAAGKIEFDAITGAEAALFHVRVPNPNGTVRVRGTSQDASFHFGESEAAAVIQCNQLDHCLIFDSHVAYLRSDPDDVPPTNGTDIELLRVTIDGALAPGAGADSGMVIGTSGKVTFSDTTITATTRGASIGPGAFLSPPEIDIERLHYLGNSRPLSVTHLVSVRDSEFRDNAAPGGADPKAGALDIVDGLGDSVTIDRCAFIDNTGNADVGGAVRAAGGASLVVRNSTFSGNTFRTDSIGFGGARGGAIGFHAASGKATSLQVQHVTIVGPALTSAGVSGTAIGGFGAAEGVSMYLYNNLLRGSCNYAADALVAASGNVEGTGNTCGFDTGSNLVDATNSALALGTLGAHGGHTPTYLPAAGSVAIDAGVDGMPCLNVDQRGYARPLGAGCDAGAVEAGDVIFADGFD